jgi:hypothetical protein
VVAQPGWPTFRGHVKSFQSWLETLQCRSSLIQKLETFMPLKDQIKELRAKSDREPA